MHRIIDSTKGLLVVGAMALAGLFAVEFVNCEVGLAQREAQATGTGLQVYAGLLRISPRMEDGQAALWASYIQEAADAYGVDSIVLLAVTHRDTAFRVNPTRGHPELGTLLSRDRLRGLVPADCRADMTERCYFIAAAAYLAWTRNECPGSTWRWVAAYDSFYCPRDEDARSNAFAREVRVVYDIAGGQAWTE